MQFNIHNAKFIIEEMKKIKIYSVFLLVCLLTTVLFTSCEQNLPNDVAKAGQLAVSATKSELVLSQKNSLTTTALNFSWTTGTNNGTGASISYSLQLDIKGNNFSKALSLNLGKGIYSRSFTVEELNDSLLSHWNCAPGTAAELEVRVISTIYSSPQSSETSTNISLKATPYQPVSKTLYLYGTASPKGRYLWAKQFHTGKAFCLPVDREWLSG